MNDLQILTSARALIADKDNWWDGTRDTLVPGKTNCAYTAIATVCDLEHEVERPCIKLARAMGVGGRDQIPAFNDSRGHAAVLVAFDRAIELERLSVMAHQIMTEALRVPVVADAPALAA